MIDKLALWMQERDQAIEGLDVDKFRKFYQKWKDAGVYDVDLPENDITVLLTMCIAALNSNNVSVETKNKAKKIMEEWIEMLPKINRKSNFEIKL